MMKIISVGPDECEPGSDDGIPLGVDKLFYWYECGSYEGSGQAVAVLSGGSVKCKDLGHCSCYGPWDGEWEDATLDKVREWAAEPWWNDDERQPWKAILAAITAEQAP